MTASGSSGAKGSQCNLCASNAADSGNDYAIFRYHINRLGRFNRPDPLAGSVGDPQSLNRYAYVLNDPCNLVDPVGLQEKCAFNVFVDFGSLRQKDAQKELMKELRRIFDTAKVGINRVKTPQEGDFVVPVVYAPFGGSTDILGEQRSNVGSVYVGSLLAFNPRATSAELGTAAGEVAAQEIGHALYPGQGHQEPTRGNLYEFSIMKPWYDPFTERLSWPPANAADIQRKCKELREKKSGAGGGPEGTYGAVGLYTFTLTVYFSGEGISLSGTLYQIASYVYFIPARIPRF